jgi:hypothetical protein
VTALNRPEIALKSVNRPKMEFLIGCKKKGVRVMGGAGCYFRVKEIYRRRKLKIGRKRKRKANIYKNN